MKEIVVYHGSQQVVEVPEFGKGKRRNDYGQGFYCTKSSELAKEWACPVKNDGYANRYVLDLSGLNVMYLTRGSFNILNWLAILLNNRTFDLKAPVSRQAREYLLDNFLPDTSSVDVMVGYRADDSYFAFAEDFINNAISLRDLSPAMELGKLGEQLVLVSPKAFEQIQFQGYEVARFEEYYFKRLERDRQARAEYFARRENAEILPDDLFILDLMRGEVQQDDPRLQRTISD